MVKNSVGSRVMYSIGNILGLASFKISLNRNEESENLSESDNEL